MKRSYYGWLIVLAAFLILFVTNGLTFVGLTVFDESILRHFEWSRSTLKLRDLVTFATAGLIAPLAGALADKYGVRILMAIGAMLLSVGLFLYPKIATPQDLYLIHFLFGLCLASCGMIVCVMLVSRWFVRRRGTAIGLAMVGTSLGSSLFPIINSRLLANFGWKISFEMLSILPIALLPVIIFAVREHPAIGIPLAEKHKSGENHTNIPEFTYSAAIKTRAFWTLAFTAMTTFFCLMGITSHLFLHLRGLNFEPSKAANVVGLVFAMGLVGKLFFGLLSDYLDPKKVFRINLFVMFLGTAFLATQKQEFIMPFVVLFGLGWGGLYTMLQLMSVSLFGTRSAGKILGSITLIDAIGGGLGPWIMGVFFDKQGNYGNAFLLSSALVMVAFFVSFLLKSPQKNEQPELKLVGEKL